MFVERIRPWLGRNLLGTAANVTLDLITPGTHYEPRITQLDARATKIVRFGRTCVQADLDLYNAFNASNVLANEITRFGPQWLQPTQIIGGRLIKFSGQLNF